MFKKTIILFSALALFVSSSFAGETEIRKNAKVKANVTGVYTSIPKGINQTALFNVKKDAPLLVVIKPSLSKDYTKILFEDKSGEKHGWIRTSDIEIDMSKTEYTFEKPVTITGVDWSKSFEGVIDTPNDPSELIVLELSFMDKIKTNSDKEEINRAANQK